MSKMSGKSEVDGTFTLNFGEYFGKANIKIIVDASNSIVESNEGNNTFSIDYDVIYCTHYSHNKRTQNTKNLTIRVTSDTRKLFTDNYFKNVAQWNGITDEIFISTLIFSDDSNKAADIVIQTGTNFSNTEFARTTYINDNLYKITLNSNTSGLLNQSETTKIKALVHEVGHALGLRHPEETSCYGYKSIMRQGVVNERINHLVSGNITTHDEYNLITLYE